MRPFHTLTGAGRFPLKLLPPLLVLLLMCSACGTAVPESSPATGYTAAAATLPGIGNIPADESISAAGTLSESAAPSSAEEPSTEAPLTELRLATFNIKHCAEGVSAIVSVICAADADIIGLEEVDVNCQRSGYVDQPACIAEEAGYPYHYFIRAIDLTGGEYGTAILSRYPIESFEVIKLDAKGNEGRTIGHAVIKAGGTFLDVFCTHLTWEDRAVRIEQMKYIAGLLRGCERYVLLGDLNSFDITDIRYLEADYCVNRPERLYPTFIRYGSSPDNIVVSRHFTEAKSGTIDSASSDHRLLYAIFRVE